MINLLDGLRDLKAPLGSGLIILFGFWLIFANEVASARPELSVAGNIQQLVSYLGGPATLGAVAFIAYLVGLVLSLQTMTRRVMMPVVKLLGGIRKSERSKRQRLYGIYLGNRVLKFVDQIIDVAHKNGYSDQDIVEIYDKRHGPFMAPMQFVVTGKPTRNAGAQMALIVQIIGHIDVLALQLHSSKEKLFEQYDKNKTEGDFRASITLPIIFVALVLEVRLSIEGYPLPAILSAIAALVAAYRVFVSSQERHDQADALVINALLTGEIKDSALQRLYEPKTEHTRSDEGVELTIGRIGLYNG